MLNFQSAAGYRYFGYNSFLPDVMEKLISFENVDYIFVQEHFDISVEEQLADLVAKEYELLISLTGPGGGGYGLSYDVYKRKE